MTQKEIDLDRIPEEFLPALDALARRLRSPFQNFLDALSRPHSENPDWWVSEIAYRHPSILFYRICKILFARSLIQSGSVTHVLANNEIDQFLIDGSDRLRTKQKLSVLKRLIGRLIRAKNRASDYIQLCIDLHKRSSAAKKTGTNKTIPKENVIIVETYLTESYIDQDDSKDRYYPGMMDGAPEPGRIYFIFNLFQEEKYESFFKRIRAGKRNYIIKEDYLTRSDYLYALRFPFRILGCIPDAALFEGVDFAPLIKEVITGRRFAPQSVESLLNLRFMHELKNAGWKVERLIDWFENQWMDKGLHLGFNQSFPDSDSVGYQGFPQYDLFLNLFPTEVERRANTLPRRIAVIGRALMEPVREFAPSIPVTLAPAYRFQHVWRNNPKAARQKTQDRFTALVAVPYFRSMAEEFIEMVIRSAEVLRDISFEFKPHPTEVDYVMSAFKTKIERAGCKIVTGSFEERLLGANLFVSTASSTCLEAMASGIPCLVVASTAEPTSLPFPAAAMQKKNDQMYSVCYGVGDLVDAISRLRVETQRDPEEFASRGRDLREEFFEQVTPLAAAVFLGKNQSN